MKFEQFAYTRPDVETMTTQFNALATAFETATSASEQLNIAKQMNELRTQFNSMYSICHIRHTINTKDAFYDAENTYFDDVTPSFEALNNRFYDLLLHSKFRPQLEKKWGKQLFIIAELSKKTFKPIILEDLQEENKLTSEYMKTKARAALEFEGKTYNLSSFVPIETAIDRNVRKAAANTKWAFYARNQIKIEQIFDNLVKTRHRIAQKLGYKNFIELGYIRMLRSDYNAQMVANFRKQVETLIVPIASDLYARQRQRLGLDQLYFYDEDFKFQSGNPKPQGKPEWIVKAADMMYSELSDETRRFFRQMRRNQLMDLVAKDGKATGGYCTFVGQHKAPYIFANFNGTSGDVDVLTHEAGHAFQVFSSRNAKVSEYHWPTYEACEIHSMSMEFFTWPWMNLFFEQDTDKYKFAHLSGAVLFLPYGVAVDEFQHFVYENPDATPAERNQAWRNIERKYLPHRNYAGNEFLENGGFWQKQNHIFVSPFYYIDYTLAQICAFQFWKKDRENHAEAWADYVRLCKAGGSQSFLELVKLANLRSPFGDDCVASVVGEIKKWLDSVDDTHF